MYKNNYKGQWRFINYNIIGILSSLHNININLLGIVFSTTIVNTILHEQ